MSTGAKGRAPAPLRRKVKRADRLLQEKYGDPPRRGPMPPLDQLVATILSQNTNDANSRRAFGNLRAAFPAWRDVVEAPVEEVEAALRTGGLARTKARRIKAILAELDSGDGPRLRELEGLSDEEAEQRLLSLKGVGPKTARCVLLFALGRDVFPLDTHVQRVLKRLGVLPSSMSANEAHEFMPALVPPGRAHALHVNLIRHGRDLCRPRSPACPPCTLKPLCGAYRGKEGQHDL